MSTHTFTTTDAFRASGSLLRERSEAGCAIASTELQRRASSGKPGYLRDCLRQGMKPASLKRTARQKTQAQTVFAFATADAQPPARRDTIKAVRVEFDARLTRVETALGDVIAAVSKTHEAVNALSHRVSDRMAA